MNQVQVLESPVKSEGDKKDYRLVQLPNGLKALLIHFNAEENSESDDMAAIMVAVKVGSFDDPRKVMGMAHFLEHILFMGSEKYPGENSFSEFLTANGGSDNAMTASEYTGYFFKIGEKVFPKALDIFAHQFISPLLSKNSMQRERESVDSEYHMALSNDGILVENIIKSFINENHPASQFDCGNLKTLKEDITDDDLHSELLKFFEKYVGNKMVLAVQSKQTLDEMQELIIECFSAIKSGSSESSIPSMTINEIFKPEFFSNMVYMKPKTVTKSLKITWTLPSMQKHYKCTPISYLSRVFGNDGEGGLDAYLKEKQLITGLTFYAASNGFGGSSQYSMPKLSIAMTDQGAEKVEEILEAIFSYLLMIKQTPIEEHRRLYNDFKEQNDLKFKFHRESSALWNVRSTSMNMLVYDNVDVIRGSSILQQFDENIIQDTIDQLNQRKFNLFIVDSNHGSFPKKETFFGAEYDELPFPEKYQKLWDERKINSEFFLEKANPFKASNFEIFANADESPKYPSKIMEDDIVEVWHKLDDKFLKPESFINVQFLSPKQTNSIESFVYKLIYDYMLSYYLKKTFSQHSSAGLVVSTDSMKKFFQVNFSGFNDKMIAFVDSVSKEIKAFHENMERAQFETIKIQQKNRYFNDSMESVDLANDYLKEILKSDFYLDLEILKTFDSITFEDLQKYIPKFFRMMKIKILIQGNMTKAQALTVGDILKTNFMCEPLNTEYELKGRCFELPLGTHICRAKSLMLNDDNSCIKNYYQIGQTNIQNHNLLKLLDSILEPKVFDYLRNKEQLGYSVGCTFNDIEGVLGLQVFVSSQEHKHVFTEVLQKMEFFMNDIAKKAVHEITDEEFDNFKQARLKLLLADPKTLQEELRRNWSEIKDNEYIFNRLDMTAKVLKNLTKSDLQEFFAGFTKPENMRQLSVQVIGNPKVEEGSQEIDVDRELKVEFLTEKLAEDEKHVGDIAKFQENLVLLPIVRFQIE